MLSGAAGDKRFSFQGETLVASQGILFCRANSVSVNPRALLFGFGKASFPLSRLPYQRQAVDSAVGNCRAQQKHR